MLDHAGLRFPDDRLFDTATGVDCKPRNLRDAIRCIPVNVATAQTLFTDHCLIQLRVAEVPQHSCEPLAYATANRPFQVVALGDVAPRPLFRLDGMTCQPYATLPGDELRAVGLPLDLTTFVSAIYFGDRAP
jgi:hypothetical protein